jgi:membrane protease YdiL (CAAX protease family)
VIGRFVFERAQPAIVVAGGLALLSRVWLIHPGAAIGPLFACYFIVFLLCVPGISAPTRWLVHPVAVTALGIAGAGVLLALGQPNDFFSSGMLPLLSTVAAVSEEALFRGVLFPWSARRFGVGAAIAISALAFAAIHVPFYGLTALPVDLAAGLLFSWQRWASGTWLSSAATHAFINLGVFL